MQSLLKAGSVLERPFRAAFVRDDSVWGCALNGLVAAGERTLVKLTGRGVFNTLSESGLLWVVRKTGVLSRER